MSDFVCDEDGTLLLDDIYRYEDIDAEFERLKKRIKIEGMLAHKNIAGLGRSIEISKESYNKFKEVYMRDYEIFSYE